MFSFIQRLINTERRRFCYKYLYNSPVNYGWPTKYRPYFTPEKNTISVNTVIIEKIPGNDFAVPVS